MKKLFHNIISLLLGILAFAQISNAQESLPNGLTIDKTVHNFGDIVLGSGPVSCTFTVTNTSSKPAVIYSVTSSCGCTDVKWTREPLRPGAKGTISATYSNDEGPYPFDKSLTVYFSDTKKPLILKLRGNCTSKKLSLTEAYPVKFGAAGVKSKEIKVGNLEQGRLKSTTVKIANTSSKPINVSFTDVSPELSLKLSQNPIPAGQTADLTATVKASREKWGKNWYKASVCIDGKKQNGNLSFWAFTKENFDALSQDQKAKGPRPNFKESTFSFGKVKKGTKIEAVFEMKNEGKEDFKVYKADADKGSLTYQSIPSVSPGGSITIKMTLDTASMPAGEALSVVTLTTNSPLRPIVNLFIAGWLE